VLRWVGGRQCRWGCARLAGALRQGWLPGGLAAGARGRSRARPQAGAAITW
jgi:hypothetical protein